jgi:hypothetical protein
MVARGEDVQMHDRVGPGAMAPSDTSGLPNFLVIGAMKSGTTSLFNYLRAHPQIFMSPLKEADFFVEEKNWQRGLDWYRTQFAAASAGSVAIGEASTSYSKYPEYRGVPEKIAACLPDVRLIYVVRDPIERIRSHYEHDALVGREHAPIDEAVLADPRYVDCSRYAFQLERYLNWFPRERILVIASEELRSSRASTMRLIYRFLEVDDAHRPDELEREFYTTQERSAYPSYAWRIRRIAKRYLPAGHRAKELIDRLVPASLGRVRSDGPAAAPAPTDLVTDGLRATLQELLKDDVRKLNTYMPDGFDGWGIA